MTVVAHAGHWLANVAYAAPVLVLLGWLAVTKLKERRGRSASDNDRVAPD